MSEETINTRNKRRPWIADTLSFIMPGLGHVYCGRLVKGLVLLFIFGLPVIALETLMIFKTSAVTMPLALIAIILSYMLYFVVIVDSHYLARNTKVDYALKEYNRWYVYMLLVLINMGSSVTVALSIRANYFEAFYVPSFSMFPTIHNGDRFITNKIVYKNTDPQRGDIVVFKNPENRHMNYIKRIVAIAGDTVEMKSGELIINGQTLQRTSLGPVKLEKQNGEIEGQITTEQNGRAEYRIFLANESQRDKNVITDFDPIKVPQNHCFVLGDNRFESKDSRHFGAVPLATIKGRAGFLYFPSEDWSRFGKMN